MKSLRLAWRALARDWRAGELRVLGLAVVIAVASVTSVGVFADRIREALLLQANALLAADLVVRSPEPLPASWAQTARSAGLRVAHTLSLTSMLVSGKQLKLAQVKAVSAGYPLRGSLRTAADVGGANAPTRDLPSPGTVWVDTSLAAALKLRVGGRIELGSASFTVGRLLTFEPDRGAELFSIAPRVLMRLEDLARTKLVQPGSRVGYRLLVAGPRTEVENFRSWLSERLSQGQRLYGVRNARPELKSSLETADRFLGLAALLSVLLAGVAVATSARRFAERHFDSSAVLSCLGASQSLIARVYTLQVLLIGAGASALGGGAGYGAQAFLARTLESILGSALPAPSLAPLGFGMTTGMVTVFGFAWPPLLSLKDVPPTRVLRRDLVPLPGRSMLGYAMALATLSLLMYWQVQDLWLTAAVAVGVMATLLLLGLIAVALLGLLTALRRRMALAWRTGLGNVARRARGSAVQIVALGLGLMALLTLSLVRNDLLEAWRSSLPRDAPNQFVINIQPQQVSAMEAFLSQRGLSQSSLYPMVRGRLVEINGRRVRRKDYDNPRAQRLVQREFNLSWAAALAPDNHVVRGRWWSPAEHGTAEFSVEQGLAETLGLHLGDMLSFRVSGQLVRAPITSLRHVAWDSFRANFFVLAPPGELESFPATYITSFHLSESRQGLLRDMVERFPNVTVLDVDAIMTQVRHIADRVTLAVQYIFLFAVAAGLVVLYAAIHATRDERIYESAVMRVLGASRRQVMRGILAEFGLLGTLAGAVGALAASSLGYVLATRVFDVGYRPDPWLWVVGIVGGAVGVILTGWMGTRSVMRRPPLDTLRAG